MDEKKHHKWLECVSEQKPKEQCSERNKIMSWIYSHSFHLIKHSPSSTSVFAKSFFYFRQLKWSDRQSVKVYSPSSLSRWDSQHWSAHMRLSNYIYCTLTPSVCSCGTRCYAALPACNHTNTPNSYCHIQFALMHMKAKFAAYFTLVCTTHLDCHEQTVLPDSRI